MVDVVQSSGKVVEDAVVVGLAWVTGQTVVLTAMTEVTTRAGHLVSSGAHDVMVEVTVV